MCAALAFVPYDYVILNPEEAKTATDLYVMEFSNCESFEIHGVIYLSSWPGSEDPCKRLRELAIEKFPVIEDLEKLQVGPVYAPGDIKITNAEIVSTSPIISYSMALDYDWDFDADPICKIIRKK